MRGPDTALDFPWCDTSNLLSGLSHSCFGFVLLFRRMAAAAERAFSSLHLARRTLPAVGSTLSDGERLVEAPIPHTKKLF